MTRILHSDGIRKRIDAPIRRLAQRLAALGIGPGALMVAGFVVSLAALPLIGLRYYGPGLALVVLGRGLAVLARTSPGRAVLGATLDVIAFAGVPFAFALADPSRAVAGAFLLFAIVALSAVSFAFGAFARGIPRIEFLLSVVVVAIVCIFPDHFSLMAYLTGIACFVLAGDRIARAIARGGA